MSSSRKRKEVVQEQVPPGPLHDANKFKSRKAENFFVQYERRQCNAEREFDFEDLGLDDIVERYKWRNLAGRPKHNGVALLVKEFYANVHELGNCGESYVRGRPVNYSSEVINQYYSMPDVEECTYSSTIGAMEKEWKKKIHVIQSTFGHVEINLNDGGKLLPVKKLRHRLRYLHRFISERILPSAHSHVVHWKRAWLMHLVLQGEPINTGLIISNQIAHNVKKLSNVNFKFPCLITYLISKARVNLPSKDLKPGPKIDLNSMTKKGHIQSGEAVSGSSDEDGGENEEEEGEGNEGNDEDMEEDPEEARIELFRRDPARGMYVLSLAMTSVRGEVSKLCTKFNDFSTSFEAAEQRRIAEAMAAQAHRDVQDERWAQLMGYLRPQGSSSQQPAPPHFQPQEGQFQQFQSDPWGHHFRPPPQ